MVFQSYTSFAWRTVRQNVEYGLELQGIAADERKARALKLIQQVGLKDFADALPETAVGRHEAARGHRPHAREPAARHLDGRALRRARPADAVGHAVDDSRRARTQDNSVLFVTHDVSEAVYLADVIFVLSHRPAKVLHRIEVPFFEDREKPVKQSADFKRVEAQVLDMLHSLNVQGNVRVGL
jgi:NitT/TauT family transport system ATP-binding protein